ncbi:MAG: histidinol-phosphate transaminase [bacterium]|nr:histidinol-phosphate transaminase [bacterium]
MSQLIINRNENLYGPAPKVLETIHNFDAINVSRYQEGYYNSPLAKKISAQFAIPEEQVIIFYGLEDFFRNLFSGLDKKQDSILVNQWHFAYFKKYADFLQIKFLEFKLIENETDFSFDIDDCLKIYNEQKPKILILTSPNNPTGNVLPFAELEKVLNNISLDTLFILDEAYFGYEQNYQLEKYLALLAKYPNLMLVRTFSKYYALAGLRIGFALAGKKAKEMINYQHRYLGFSTILENIALAALDSESYYEEIAQKIIKERDWFINQVRTLKNFKIFNSQTNFVLLRVNEKIIDKLKEQIAKEEFVIALFLKDNMMRVSSGLPEHNQKFLALLKNIDNL